MANLPAPKKVKKISLFEFQNEVDTVGSSSWADDVSDLPTNVNYERSTVSHAPSSNARPATPPMDLPHYGPFVAKFINLDYRTSEHDFAELFDNSFKIVEIKMPLDMDTNRSRGFAFVEFEDRDSLGKALQLDGQTFQGRNMRVILAEQRQQRPGYARREQSDDGKDRDFDNWDRRGPLPPLAHDRPQFSRRDHAYDDGKERDFGNWERRGPLPSLDNERSQYPRREHAYDDGKERDFGNWERRGPPPGNDHRPYGGGFRSHRDAEEDPRDYDAGFRSNRAPRPPLPEDNRDYDHWEHKGPLTNDRPRGGRRGGFPLDGHRMREKTEEEKAVDGVDNWRTSGPRSPLHTFEPAKPAGRPRLHLAPRTKPIEANAPAPSTSSSVFGAAKPVDTSKKFLEMEEREAKLHAERVEREQRRAAKKESRKAKTVEATRQSFSLLTTEDGEEKIISPPTAPAQHLAAEKLAAKNQLTAEANAEKQ